LAGAKWRPKFFIQSPNGKVRLPESVGKTFPLQQNTSQNYWLPRACWQKTSAEIIF